MYKFMKNDRVKVLTSENMEMLLDTKTGKIESYVNLLF